MHKTSRFLDVNQPATEDVESAAVHTWLAHCSVSSGKEEFDAVLLLGCCISWREFNLPATALKRFLRDPMVTKGEEKKLAFEYSMESIRGQLPTFPHIRAVSAESLCLLHNVSNRTSAVSSAFFS